MIIHFGKFFNEINIKFSKFIFLIVIKNLPNCIKLIVLSGQKFISNTEKVLKGKLSLFTPKSTDFFHFCNLGAICSVWGFSRTTIIPNIKFIACK